MIRTLRFKLLMGLAALGVALTLMVLWLLEPHELKAERELPLSFAHAGNTLTGTLLLPAGPGPHPVVSFVHGDGAQTRGLEQYALVMNAFLKAGIACYSWDKLGTGQSQGPNQGNWLEQTMSDRAEEAAAAMAMLAQRPELDAKGSGLIGFSQGAWVLAQAAQWGQQGKVIRAPAFLITVGGAVDWASQGEYFTRMRLARAGMADAQAVQRVIAWQRGAPQPDVTLGHADYLRALAAYVSAAPVPPGANSEPLSAQRYRFVALNRRADVSTGLFQTQAPLLAVWGAQDLNVDAPASAQRYAELLNAGPSDQALHLIEPQHHAVKVFEGGDHKLLNAADYAGQLPQEWTWAMSARYLWQAEAAFAPGYLELLPAWTLAQLRRR
ncbi:alpha/beta hydrolase family protein [Roseateles oligotrophus]|uniref:Alpha/beta hydrolase n=1 Tax=Roseateles oligotrophus TaxID=1769250 RepID=A0ABT2YH64_9BURK|nr:alpha/beta hydrolase [Roseateles oligotrophus]MCV2369393.1 alpha/beta hydrolase [Roseateles oligotrophus]